MSITEHDVNTADSNEVVRGSIDNATLVKAIIDGNIASENETLEMVKAYFADRSKDEVAAALGVALGFQLMHPVVRMPGFLEGVIATETATLRERGVEV